MERMIKGILFCMLLFAATLAQSQNATNYGLEVPGGIRTYKPYNVVDTPGLLFFNKTTGGYYWFDGVQLQRMADSASLVNSTHWKTETASDTLANSDRTVNMIRMYLGPDTTKIRHKFTSNQIYTDWKFGVDNSFWGAKGEYLRAEGLGPGVIGNMGINANHDFANVQVRVGRSSDNTDGQFGIESLDGSGRFNVDFRLGAAIRHGVYEELGATLPTSADILARGGYFLYARDRDSVAGTAGPNFITESNTNYIFADRAGFGTLTPSSDFEIEKSDATFTLDAIDGIPTQKFVLGSEELARFEFSNPVDSFNDGQFKIFLEKSNGIGTGNLIYRPNLFEFQEETSINTTTGDLVLQGSGGNVGIGTETPARKLSITGGTAGSTDSRLLRLGETSLTDRYDFSLETDDHLRLNNGSNDNVIMSWNKGGNVGIGTASPIGALNVVTGSASTADLLNQGNGSISFVNQSGGNELPTIAGKSSSDRAGLNLLSGNIDVKTNSDMAFNIRENDNTDFATLTSPGFQFQRFSTNLMTILRNGRVGINITNPQDVLHVGGNIRVGTSTSERLDFNFDDPTNVGRIRVSAGGEVPQLEIKAATISTEAQFNFKTHNGTSHTEALVILENNNVGIGKNNPSVKLDVAGQIKADNILEKNEGDRTDTVPAFDTWITPTNSSRPNQVTVILEYDIDWSGTTDGFFEIDLKARESAGVDEHVLSTRHEAYSTGLTGTNTNITRFTFNGYIPAGYEYALISGNEQNLNSKTVISVTETPF